MRCVIACLLLAGMMPVLGACDRQSGKTEQERAAPRSHPVVADESAEDEKDENASYKVDTRHKGSAAPDFTFEGPDGQDVTLADFAGKPVLVNLWATWCGPCVAEMPTLDAVAKEGDRTGLVVLTISQDNQSDKVAPFFAKNKYARLKAYLDPENQFGFHYSTGLLPTSVLYDRNGKEVARVTGAMDWQSERARKLIAAAVT